MNKKITKTLALLSTVAILANCGGAGNSDDSDDTKPGANSSSDFAEVTIGGNSDKISSSGSSGEISMSSLKGAYSGSDNCLGALGCAAYAIGHSEDGVNFRAISGFQPDDIFNDGGPPSGAATIYETRLEFASVDVASGQHSYYDREIYMEFDPSAGTFKGGDKDMDFNTKVDGFDYKGTFSGVDFENGVVEGKISRWGHIAAFHGSNEDTVLAGFMMGYREPDD